MIITEKLLMTLAEKNTSVPDLVFCSIGLNNFRNHYPNGFNTLTDSIESLMDNLRDLYGTGMMAAK